jgi:large subunit ribosomal protein L1
MTSKKYQAAKERVERDRFYSIQEAVELAQAIKQSKFDETVEIALVLGTNAQHADQSVRGTVTLPHGTGKTARVIVFASGDKASAAEEAGADEVGADELVAKVQAGFIDFDVAVATPELMGKVGTLGRVLGPRGLMPNPKTGTVTADPAQAVRDIKGGKIEFRADRHSNLHFIIGKVSFAASALVENYQTALEEIRRSRPAAVSGRFIEKAVLSTTMGPGIPLSLTD